MHGLALRGAATVIVVLLLSGCGGGKSSPTTSSAASTAVGNAVSTAVGSASAPAAPAATAATASMATASGAGTVGPEGIPLEQGPALAPASSTSQGTAVDRIQCAPVEQLAYHIHAHLQVYVEGQPRQLPAGIGLIGPVAEQTPNGPFYGAQRCYYWLHTHASDGVIHIESPSARVYTLGNFFDEWQQPLSSTQVGPATGKVSAFLNGQPWTKSPRTIPLLREAVILLDVGTPVVPLQAVSFDNTGL